MISFKTEKRYGLVFIYLFGVIFGKSVCVVEKVLENFANRTE